MLANSLVKSALLLQRVSALKHVSVCVRCCANQSEQPPSSSFADAARDQRSHAVLQYWLGEGYATAGPCAVDESKKRIWYAGGSEVDKEVTQRFGKDLAALQAGRYDDWTRAYDGLAYIVLADQMSRNIHRGKPESFMFDELALRRTKAMLRGAMLQSSGEGERVRPAHRTWLIMPFMHSEELADQRECVRLSEDMRAVCEALDAGGTAAKMFAANASFARRHLAVIERFGRFPHRNELLGRQCTAAEAAALADGSVDTF